METSPQFQKEASHPPTDCCHGYEVVPEMFPDKVSLVKVIGQLDPHATFVSNSLIVPIVATVDTSAHFVANESEVSRILTVPLTRLAHEDSYENEWWSTPRGDLNIHFFYLDDETIWGATGRILRQLFDIVC